MRDVPLPDLDRLGAIAAHLEGQDCPLMARQVRAAIEEIRAARAGQPARPGQDILATLAGGLLAAAVEGPHDRDDRHNHK